jgi:hypothetical protein
MRASFYSANIVGKSSDVVAPIRSALEAAQKYVDFGLRLVDVEERPRPPLTGREEDLIRRYGLSQNDTFSGTDLRWWGSARKDYGAGGETPVWSKILFGRFAVRGHDMMSRPYFLKLESKDNGARSSKAAQTLAAIRSHGAVQAHLESDTRSLLVTAQATRSDHDPIGLESFLRRPPEEVEGLLPQVAEDIALDVAYGTPTTEPHPRSALLWRIHKSQEAAYDELWSSFSGEEAIKPSSLIGRFFEADVTDWIPWRACLHGDLHLGNVALDEDAGVVRAAVFDPGSMEAGACGRDIATLEVSLILHQTAAEPGILHVCRHLYDGSWADGTHPIQPGGSDIAVNTGRLLSLLREKALQESAVSVYRRLLLDSALIQLGSLLYGLSGNKIQRQPEAVELYRCLARWELEENGDI